MKKRPGHSAENRWKEFIDSNLSCVLRRAARLGVHRSLFDECLWMAGVLFCLVEIEHPPKVETVYPCC